MPEPQAILLLRVLPPDAPFPLPAPFHHQTPAPAPAPAPTATPPNPLPPPAAPLSSSSSARPPHPWEIAAHAWLESFPDGSPPTEPEVDAYIDAHRLELPSLPRLPAPPAPPRTPRRPGFRCRPKHIPIQVPMY